MIVGVAYYPEHWNRSLWIADADLMQKTGVQLVRMAEFAWSRLEPKDGVFDFSWLDEAISIFEKRGIKDTIHLKKGVIGSERWGDKMRRRIANELGVELYDIYGLTEVYGPGIGMSCKHQCGMHYWDDFVYFEIINPKTGEVLPDGEYGELVITTLRKQGAPLIRYRTHDLTRIIPGECACGSKFPRIDILIGRSDDMVKVKGVNIYPGQIEDVLRDIPGVSSEYQVMIDHLYGKDIMTLFFETDPGVDREAVGLEVQRVFKAQVGLTIIPKPVAIGELPRSEKKSTRVFDNRY